MAPARALHDAGVPVRYRAERDWLGRTGVRAALAYLRIATRPAAVQGDDLVDVRKRPSRGLPAWIDKWLVNCDSVDAVWRVAEKLDDAKVASKVEDLAVDLDTIVRVAQADGATTRSILEAVRDRVGLGAAMGKLDRSKGLAAAGNHLDDLATLVQLAALHPDPAGFEEWLRRPIPYSPEGVELATIHRVKGREYPLVVVFGVDEGIIPHRLAADVEEERRILHVGITRGIERVVVLTDRESPSPFLPELTGEAAPAAAARPPAAAPVASSALRDALRAWRAERARADGVPAYVVLNDKHLDAIAERGPRDERDLLRCPGIGAVKLDRYGEEILAIVANSLP
jgi:DNA helicase-2/ATP-dependent DNA helicase PcrA